MQLVLEGLRDKQTHDVLLMEKQDLEKKIQQATICRDTFEMKAARIEEQVASKTRQEPSDFTL